MRSSMIPFFNDHSPKQLERPGKIRRRSGVRRFDTTLAICLTACVVVPAAAREAWAAYASPQVEALLALHEASSTPMRIAVREGFPRIVGFDVPAEGATPVEWAEGFLEDYLPLYRQDDPDLSLTLRRADGEEDDFSDIVSFHQTYRGIPVFAGRIAVFMGMDAFGAPRIFMTSGALLPAVELDTVPATTASPRRTSAPSATPFGPWRSVRAITTATGSKTTSTRTATASSRSTTTAPTSRTPSSSTPTRTASETCATHVRRMPIPTSGMRTETVGVRRATATTASSTSTQGRRRSATTRSTTTATGSRIASIRIADASSVQ